MAVLFALSSALVVGTSDFFGGFASRHTKAVIATTAAHAAGAGFFLIAAPIAGGSLQGNDLSWSIASGVAGAGGILSLYRGIGSARVSIVSPMAGVGAAAVPAVYSTIRGEDLSSVAALGVIIGLIAIALVSRAATDGEGSVLSSLAYGSGAGLGLGTLLLGLGQTSADAGLWPLLPSRLAGFSVLLVLLIATKEPISLPRAARPSALGAGVLSACGNALFLAGTQVGSLAVVAVVTAMFPAVTVLWARSVFSEHLTRVQVTGLVLALASIALVASSG